MSSCEGATFKELSLALGQQIKEIFKARNEPNNDYSYKNQPKIKPGKPSKKPKPAKKDGVNDSETSKKALKRKNFEKDKIISLMECEIEILYDEIKLMVRSYIIYITKFF